MQIILQSNLSLFFIIQVKSHAFIQHFIQYRLFQSSFTLINSKITVVGPDLLTARISENLLALKHFCQDLLKPCSKKKCLNVVIFVTDLIACAFVGVSLSDAKFMGEEYYMSHDLLKFAVNLFVGFCPILYHP